MHVRSYKYQFDKYCGIYTCSICAIIPKKTCECSVLCVVAYTHTIE
ncbi:hypothetical protein HMPREF3190_01268 [Umbribacter vaginalis]|nr:hypothetical protein HMPREF3190_01268 [Coriobacteriales bacterium DNF00809]